MWVKAARTWERSVAVAAERARIVAVDREGFLRLSDTAAMVAWPLTYDMVRSG